MPPKRKPEKEGGEDLHAGEKKSISKKTKTSAVTVVDVTEGDETSSSPPSAKPKKEKVALMSNYMPSTWSNSTYEVSEHVTGNAYKIVSYNVNGLSASVEKGFVQYVDAENADILAIQETKLQESKVAQFDKQIEALGYPYRYWSCSIAKKGYAGTAVFSKIKPVRVSYGLGASGLHNEEGRTINAEFENFHLVNCYVPNSGQKLERLGWREEVWDTAMLQHLKELESGEGAAAVTPVAAKTDVKSFFHAKSAPSSSSSSSASSAKPVIFTGDLNVAHEEIDIKNVKSNKNKTAGFCDSERQGMTNYLASGFDDTYRRLHPEEVAYTYWGMRFNSYASDSGWRLDYFLTSNVLRERIQSMLTRKEVYGASDHCPIVLIINK